MAALPGTARMGAKLSLRLARAFMPLRETGRAGMLCGLDAGRAAVQRIGTLLAAQRVLEAADDIYFLHLEEIRQADKPSALADARLWVSDRKARREYYKAITLPQAWAGVPEPIVAARPGGTAAQRQTVIQGIGITDASVEGIARVITDPADADDFEPGEILICPITDPSWASLFVIAAGVVIDVGGPMSHGAIVAREMGIPCIINTKSGTREIATGMRVLVDGKAGTATVLANAAEAAA
jgi:pyruvate,water dikinase